jgi:hypothetical protein
MTDRLTRVNSADRPITYRYIMASVSAKSRYIRGMLRPEIDQESPNAGENGQPAGPITCPDPQRVGRFSGSHNARAG